MKRYLFAFIISLLFLSPSFALDKTKDSNQSFYNANALYEKGEYGKAVEAYIKILDMGLESGNIYYNIGNGFLKLGHLGYAILCYEKAKRLIPGDSDLQSNLSYAKSLAEDSSFQAPQKIFIIRMIERPFKDFNLNTVFLSAAILYVAVITVLTIFIINPAFARKAKFTLLAILAAFFLNSAAFAIRLFDEEISKHGIVVQKEVECKYEPIEKATTYYKLHEGNEVLMLETKNSWLKIKRLDGKLAWVKKEAVEKI